MRKIDLIVIHCSATCEDRPFTGQALEAAHRRRGFDGTGYHFYIRRDGQILTTRPVERAGAHARGYNAHSIGIAYEGGLDHYGNPKDTRTEWQRHSLRVLVRALLMDYPEAKVAGHRDLSPSLFLVTTSLFLLQNTGIVSSIPSFPPLRCCSGLG